MRVSNDIAIHLYRALGFVDTGIRRGYYTDNREDALIMWRDPIAEPRIVILAHRDAPATRPPRPSSTPTAPCASNVVASQAELHARYGGVVPEVASRRHLELVVPVVEQALAEAGATLDDIDAVAVTEGPG